MATSDRHWYPSADMIDMAGRQVRRVWELTRSDEEGKYPTISARVEVIGGAPELRHLAISAPEGGSSINAETVRKFDIEGMIEYMGGAERGLSFAMGENGESGRVVAVDGIFGQIEPGRLATRKARKLHRKITPDFLREVADVYRKAGGDAPVRAVAEHFGKERRQATNYVREARARGFLEEASDG